jgi:hypothetical protein
VSGAKEWDVAVGLVLAVLAVAMAVDHTVAGATSRWGWGWPPAWW